MATPPFVTPVDYFGQKIWKSVPKLDGGNTVQQWGIKYIRTLFIQMAAMDDIATLINTYFPGGPNEFTQEGEAQITSVSDNIPFYNCTVSGIKITNN